MAFHDSENSRKFLARDFRAVEQGLDVAAQDRQRRAQFVRDISDKIPPDLIHLLQFGNVMEQNEHTGDLACLVPCRDGVEFDLRTIQSQLAANWATMIESIINYPVERRVAHNLQQRCPLDRKSVV